MHVLHARVRNSSLLLKFISHKSKLKLHVIPLVANDILYHVFPQPSNIYSCGMQKGNLLYLNQSLLSQLNFEQKRNFSADFYNRYLSPDVPPIRIAQDVLESFHTITGLPWWASIALATFTLRTLVTLPLAVYSQKIMTKVELLQPEIVTLSKRLKVEVKHAVHEFGWEKKKARLKYNTTMKKLIRELYIRENCHPFKASAVVWFQLPMWICLSFALRNMSGYIPIKGVEAAILAPGLLTEGLLWFTNLTIPDSTFILPVTLGILNLIIIEMNVLQSKNPTRFQNRITYLLRGVSLLMIPIGATVPSCMCWYWTCSSFYGLLQNILLKYPTVRYRLSIPKTPSQSDTPFRDIYNAARTKYVKNSFNNNGPQNKDSGSTKIK